ncbi:6-hydroxy-D-nicotine oxidase [Talaromyces proteolyticus]|uniref:6-hydroxy-D-nicotine oxidase n=1 Tax=Talaromyces proteolyticus TaxID=1131652 RepID=A0AAD4L500_9EURO|nr:6-hydroxy-D-nicotine oxidase [Talaromyces proteolyticus]KAH8704705.1 6-hydroxy-D-nicotine oxidase [Talaromyces proteolyticus]
MVVSISSICLTAVGLSSLSGLAAAQHIISAAQKGAQCCNLLTKAFPSKVAQNGTTAYTTEDQNFWSTSEWLSPSCIFEPTQAKDVAKAVKLFADNECEFAIRGGGHSAVPGAANIDDGILITFTNMKNVSIHTDKEGAQFVSVQPGAVWGDVYAYCDQYSVVPMCGRYYPVGTGLALGAGFSFLSNENGFAVDNVKTYEVILADGTILEASQTSHPDLFRSLKGGGNNFGVVTRYDLYLYQGGPVVGGQIQTPENQTEKWLDLTYDYSVRQAVVDVKTHALPAILYLGDTDEVLTSTPVYYNAHNSSALPPIMAGWYNMTASSDTVRQASYAALAKEFNANQGDGSFQEQRTYTITANREEYARVWYSFLEWGRSIENVTGLTLLHCNMPLTPRMMEAGVEKGSNSLGLAGTDDVLSILYFGLTLETYNETIVNSFNSIFATLQEESKSRGLLNPYIMWNYAGLGQEVFPSYGYSSLGFMKKVSKRYDPKGVFQRLVPGGFKLN